MNLYIKSLKINNLLKNYAIKLRIIFKCVHY